MADKPLCNFCKTPLSHTFVDLGCGPMVSAYLTEAQLQDMEPFFPLHSYVCSECLLVQLPEAQAPEDIFSDYPYFSSVSKSWLVHIETYVEEMMERLELGADSQVVEIASNDGYMLQFFKQRGVKVQGVEPAANVAKVAIEQKDIPTVVRFFGKETAELLVAEGKQADLLAGNNVLGHVPDLNDFVSGMKLVLKPGGVSTVEFAYLLTTMQGNQFDQVFHEHCSYISLVALEKIYAAHGLRVFDTKETRTHGGSLRVYACHVDDPRPETEAVQAQRAKERDYGLEDLATYAAFSQQAIDTKHKLLEFLIGAKRDGKSIVGYGAPGKGCVMLNYCGIRGDFLDYLVDLNPVKQGLYMPGVHLPILHPDTIAETKPDYLLILPWNLREEIMEQLAYCREWGAKFVVPSPVVKVYD